MLILREFLLFWQSLRKKMPHSAHEMPGAGRACKKGKPVTMEAVNRINLEAEGICHVFPFSDSL
jgi:hypothetical protein